MLKQAKLGLQGFPVTGGYRTLWRSMEVTLMIVTCAMAMEFCRLRKVKVESFIMITEVVLKVGYDAIPNSGN